MTRVARDDEVYFHHKGEPKVGRVLCSGKHGCVVDHEGEQHKLKWQHIRGHKKRAPLDYQLVDHGEDGAIVQDKHGKKRFVGIPPEARADQLKLDSRPQQTKPRHTAEA